MTTSLLPIAALVLGFESTEGLSAVLGALVLGTLVSGMGILLLLVPVALWSAGNYSASLTCAFLLVLGGFQVGVLLGEHVGWACLANAIPLVIGLYLIWRAAHQQEV